MATGYRQDLYPANALRSRLERLTMTAGYLFKIYNPHNNNISAMVTEPLRYILVYSLWFEFRWFIG